MVVPAGLDVRVHVQGETRRTWSAVFADLAVEPGSEGRPLISGELPDQAALHGLLAAIRELGLELVSGDTDAIPHTASETGGM